MYSKGGKPVELVQSSYRGGLYKYTVRLKRIRVSGYTIVDKEDILNWRYFLLRTMDSSIFKGDKYWDRKASNVSVGAKRMIPLYF